MPMVDVKSGDDLGVRVVLAKTFLARVAGLIGTERLEQDRALLFVPGTGIHTFGMKYPIDALFLDKKGTVIQAVYNLVPNKMTGLIASAHSVLEFTAGFLQAHGIEKGDRFRVEADEEHKPALQGMGYLFHWPVNIFMALLWARFITHALGQWVYQGGLLNTGLIIHNTILLVLFLTRRRSKDTSLRFWDWLIPGLTVASAMLLNPDPFYGGRLGQVSIVLQALGISAMIVSVLSLGKSFGIIPANRTVKYSGAYRIVRHPLYASEIIFHIGFLMGNMSLRNLLLVTLIFSGQIWRALSEERLLSRDPVYAQYRTAVRFRFVPGVF